jgi:hypothetical protein
MLKSVEQRWHRVGLQHVVPIVEMPEVEVAYEKQAIHYPANNRIELFLENIATDVIHAHYLHSNPLYI